MGTLVEVDEETAALGKLAAKVYGGKSRKEFLKLVAKEHPDQPLPVELAAEEAIAAATAPLQSTVKELQEKLTRSEAMQRLEERRKPVAHLAPDALKKLETFMTEKGIADYEIALREQTRLDQIAAPRPASTGKFGRAEMPLADKDNLLYKDPARFRNNELHRLIDKRLAGEAI